jgi:hypothetical protein
MLEGFDSVKRVNFKTKRAFLVLKNNRIGRIASGRI